MMNKGGKIEPEAKSSTTGTSNTDFPVSVSSDTTKPNLAINDIKPFIPTVLDTNNTLFFKDADGRNLQLRGVNVSGSCKLPVNKPSHEPNAFFDDTNVTFVGRPFPLSEADEHLGRLRHWGFNFLRYCIAWEAIEHAGPGIYDVEYLEYVVSVLQKCKEYGFYVFIDPHQDVWSRFSGGSGAPGWTLRLVGFDPSHFGATAAAIVHNTFHEPSAFPRMIWPSNYDKLACATMFTCFFGGSIFAPSCNIKDEITGEQVNIQEYLQSHYINSVCQLTQRIKAAGGLEDVCVVGYDTFNEPHHGWIGVHSVDAIPEDALTRNGLVPTPFQSMLLGEGLPTAAQVWGMSWRGFIQMGTKKVDPGGTRAWKDDSSCIWAREGVWDISTQKVLRPNHFAVNSETGKMVDFYDDCFKPFVRKYTSAIRSIHNTAVIFVEPPVMVMPPKFNKEKGDPTDRIVYAPHWYDGMTLFNKSFNRNYTVDVVSLKYKLITNPLLGIRVGEAGIKACFKNQLDIVRRYGHENLGVIPTVMGEIGIPFDMDDKAAYASGDYSNQVAALDASMHALESNMLSFTLWNYATENTHMWGDGWNGEDLSLFSRSVPRKLAKLAVNVPVANDENTETTTSTTNHVYQYPTSPTPQPAKITIVDDYDEGGRALPAFVRPYAIATPGIPTKFSFDMATATMRYTFTTTPATASKSHICEFYLPKRHYPSHQDTEVITSSGRYCIDIEKQRLYWVLAAGEDGASITENSILVRRKSAVSATRARSTSSRGVAAKDPAEQNEYICPGCIIL
ncbi:hypothetical protein SeMB42_g04314 [Synchytrium endobioticum]|uniref:Glycoside hydrolase family 5 domain-containing protein n=1 Tax=Synchytrium endobioticum TaxID=286115 RepID=A0A507CNM9_9FUNG|nr:hypothetical protein SeLEV6574_g06445 [Synchytrium endobioticum]TPX44500.1 hypothetical protein SeMB42_g04314 [Synchytrium endobioticum]